MSTQIEIKPCPFCGSEARPVWIQTFTNERMTGCSNTKCFLFRIEETVLNWNARPIEDALFNTLLREANHWIPVSDRLPEHGVLVLVTRGKSVCEAKYYLYTSVIAKHGWYEVDGMSLGVSYATHWMPLPEPPEVNHVA